MLLKVKDVELNKLKYQNGPTSTNYPPPPPPTHTQEKRDTLDDKNIDAFVTSRIPSSNKSKSNNSHGLLCIFVLKR